MAEQGFVSKYQKKIEEEEKELEELLKQSEDPEDLEDLEDDPSEQSSSSEQSEKEPLNEEEKTFKKRYGDLRRHSQKREKELKDKIDELTERLENREGASGESVGVPSTVKELEEWKQKYPDVAQIIDTMIEQGVEARLKDHDKKFEQLTEAQKQTAKDRAYAKILQKHPDFEDLQAEDDFHDWAEAQPKWVQTALYEQDDDADSVIRVIDFYKMEKGLKETPKPSKKEEQKKAATATTKTTKAQVDTEQSGSKIKESWVANLSSKEYEKHAEKIDDAIRNGDFVYDISGGAR